MKMRFFGLAALILLACGGTTSTGNSGQVFGGSTATGSGGTHGAGGASGGAAGAGGVLSSKTCAPACAPPLVCSAAGTCIAKGSCAVAADCAKGEACDPGSKTCKPGGGCGGQKLEATPVAPNLLIVLDRSCSMTSLVGGVSKWKIAVDALVGLTTTYAQKVRFGMTLFPDLTAPDCKQGAIPIPVAPGADQAIQTLLEASLKKADPYFPDGPCVTNIDTAVQQAATEPALGDASRESFLLLLTDGKQAGCSAGGGDKGTVATLSALHDQQKVGTFVVGFGAGADPTSLNAFATAGGEPKQDPNDPTHQYYQAEDAAALSSALDTIIKSTFGCKLALADKPPNTSEIYVFFDQKDSVPRDATHASGWDYDPAQNEITFYGATCDELKKGAVTDVQVVYGCNQPIPG
jgi:hypothetical protein